MKLQGCVALIVGGSSGIGAATAKALAAKGCHLAVTWSKNERGARETGAEACQLDVTNDSQCRAVVDHVVKKFGRLDVVVNCAGITRFVKATDLEGLTADDFIDLYRINVVGTYQVIRAAAPHLKSRPIAHVINVASMAAVNGRGSSIAYAASKSALVTMTKSLARVLGPVVRVNAICPGLVESKWAEEGFGEESYESHIRLAQLRSPLKALPKPEDVAASIVACLEGCDLMTGSALFVDGGAHLGTAKLKDDERG